MANNLNERSKYRLRVAYGLLNRKACKSATTEEYEQIQLRISQLPELQREDLRALVDWVEAFDRAADAVLAKPETTKPNRQGR